MSVGSNPFRSSFAEDIFNLKYRHDGAETWGALATTLVNDVCRDFMSADEKAILRNAIADMKFIPGGRYLYYAGRPIKAYNNCFLLKAEEDSRQDWADLSWKAENCLMTGGGIGVDYSIYRPSGTKLSRTGGTASGPISKMRMINEIGREVMQGGSRRSAIYASLNHQHADVHQFLHAKDWHSMPVGNSDLTIGQVKEQDFNFPAPLDMTNISVNYDDAFLTQTELSEVFIENCRQALKTGEPGFSFNFGDKQNETLRNAPVSADTWVMTSRGYVKVAEIVGTPTELWTGKRWARATFVKTKSDVETVVVNMTGGRYIKADPTHEFLVERYNGKGERRKLEAIERVAAKDLMFGDVLHVSMPYFDTQAFSADSVSYLRGYLFGDGSFSKRAPGRGDVTFCTDEAKSIARDIDLEAIEIVKSVNWNDGRGYVRAQISDSWLFGQAKEEFPSNISLLDLPAFLAGLFDADGNYLASQNRVRLSSIHYQFLEGTRRALETLGIKSHISAGGVSSFGQRVTYQLVVAADDVARFNKMIPTRRVKVTADREAYRKSAIKVISITEGPIEDVFCCDVGVSEHSFMAEGVIISNCTEVTSEDDSDVCNLASLNMSRIGSIEEFMLLSYLGSKFLVCGTLVADLPYEKIYEVRAKNRRLGLGLMGVHEWLIQRGYRYEMNHELRTWLGAWKDGSENGANDLCDRLGITRPKAYRAIAPTGTIGIMAGTTTGIEPVFAVAYKRRYLKNGTDWHYQYVVDSAAEDLITRYGVDPEKIESAIDLAADYERRIAFQADVQDFVDMSISSTINLPAWGTELNNDSLVHDFAVTLRKYAPRLRGFTCYPDGSRGGQPLTPVSYEEAKASSGLEFQEHDSCKGGVCGL